MLMSENDDGIAAPAAFSDNWCEVLPDIHEMEKCCGSPNPEFACTKHPGLAWHIFSDCTVGPHGTCSTVGGAFSTSARSHSPCFFCFFTLRAEAERTSSYQMHVCLGIPQYTGTCYSGGKDTFPPKFPAFRREPFLTPQFMTETESDKQTDITMPKMKDGNIRRKTRILIPFGKESIQKCKEKWIQQLEK